MIGSAFPLLFFSPKHARDCHPWWLGLFFLLPVFSRFLWFILFVFCFLVLLLFLFLFVITVGKKRSRLSLLSELRDSSSESSQRPFQVFVFLGRLGSSSISRSTGWFSWGCTFPPPRLWLFITVTVIITSRMLGEKMVGSQFDCWKCYPKLTAKLCWH